MHCQCVLCKGNCILDESCTCGLHMSSVQLQNGAYTRTHKTHLCVNLACVRFRAAPRHTVLLRKHGCSQSTHAPSRVQMVKSRPLERNMSATRWLADQQISTMCWVCRCPQSWYSQRRLALHISAKGMLALSWPKHELGTNLNPESA